MLWPQGLICGVLSVVFVFVSEQGSRQSTDRDCSELAALVESSEAVATPQCRRNLKRIQSGLVRNRCRSGFEHTHRVNP